MLPKYYVYHYRDPRNNELIYVGKGCGNRYRVHLKLRRKSHFTSRIKAIINDGFIPIITVVKRFDEEELALLVECEMIALYGRRDLGTGPLLNETDGGEGGAGISPELRLIRSAQMSARMKGLKFTAEHCQNISKAGKNRELSLSHRQNISLALAKRVCKPETREKCRIASSKQVMSEASREKSRLKQLAQPRLECVHCGGMFKPAALGRFHGPKCKANP